MRSHAFLDSLALAGAIAVIPAGAQGLLFRDVTSTQFPSASTLHALDTEFGDFDKDGDLDIAVAVEMGVNRLYVNDGQGRFTWRQGAFANINRDSEDAHVADFNRDGNLDVVFVTEDGGGVPELYYGAGNGSFTDVSSRIPSCAANAVEAADVDGDGWIDIVIGCGGRNLLLINDRNGGFRNESTQRLPNHTESTQDIKLGDLDGDGDLDMVVGNEVPPNRLLINRGGGFFDDSAKNLELLVPLETREVLLVDVDRDRDLDIVFFNITCNACNQRVKDPQNRLLINDGRGRFKDETAARMPVNTFSSWDGGNLDFDADGDQDLIVCAIAVPGFSNSNLQTRAYRNDGRGFFADVTAQVMPASATGRCWDVEVADLDKDGTLDMVLGAWGTQARLLLGTVRQPTPLRPKPLLRGSEGGSRLWVTPTGRLAFLDSESPGRRIPVLPVALMPSR